MLYCIIGVICITFILICLISYWLKIMKIKKVNATLSSAITKKTYLRSGLLDNTNDECRKIKNIFNWKKSFIYGSDSIYRKYCEILNTIKINKIEEKIIALKKKQNVIELKIIKQTYGLYDAERNKILAGITNPIKNIRHIDEEFDNVTENILPQNNKPLASNSTMFDDLESECKGDKSIYSVLDLDNKTLHKLTGVTKLKKKKPDKYIEKIYQKIKELEDDIDNKDINEVLKEKGIKVED